MSSIEAATNSPGLSPRVRGNLDYRPEALRFRGSNPACAGERRAGKRRAPCLAGRPLGLVCGEGGEGVWASWWGCGLGLGP